LVFAPTSAGTISGTATVSSNASNSPQTIALAGTGSAPVSNSVALSWTAGSSSAVAFNVYRGSQSGGPYTRLNPNSVSVMQYTDSSVSSGQTYYYVATELDSSGNESAYSGEWNCTVP
jgi:fibronectin type 3 domain-containing protein